MIKTNRFPIGVTTMTLKEAIRILMMSPFYFRLDLKARQVLVREFCQLHN